MVPRLSRLQRRRCLSKGIGGGPKVNFQWKDIMKSWLHYQILDELVKARDQGRISFHAVGLYTLLYRHLGSKTGLCWPSITRMAQFAECRRQKVVNSMRELRDAGFILITKETPKGRSKPINVYHLRNSPVNQQLYSKDDQRRDSGGKILPFQS